MGLNKFTFVLVALFTISFASSFTADDCPSGMISYWQFENDLIDSYGNYNGVGSGSVESSSGIVGSGVLLNTGDAITVANNQAHSFTDNFTIEFWVRPSYDDTDRLLINKSSPSNQGYYIKRGNINGNKAMIMAYVGGSTVTSPALGIIDGNWYHVAVTWAKGELSPLKIYINGNLNGSANLNSLIGSSNPLVFGKNFNGRMDEIAFYNRALSPSEIQAHYNLGIGGNDYCYVPGGGGGGTGTNGSSSTQTNFIIPGCVLPDGGTLSAGSCSSSGRYYCENGTAGTNLNLYDTINDGTGCSKEDSSVSGVVDPCCPSDYICTNDALGSNNPGCVQRTVSCSNYTSQGQAECEAQQCFWLELEEGPVCVGRTADYSCSIYINKLSCEEDTWNVGREGLGTDACGSYFVDDGAGGNGAGYVISQDTCKCYWDEDVDECKLTYEVYPDIYGDNPDFFSCVKDFDVGICVNGDQPVNWTSGIVGNSGPNFNNPSNPNLLRVAMEAGCVNGDVTRSCGEQAIKLPGFSLFALISSIGLIGLFYIIRERKK